ncbi:MAG: hypothetical protein CFE36_14365 [Sphingomonadaceae bacterium PASS1]|nr:MAG: hypothetical protein CFE36_14365 [Sphingomonadaceae bacterium PASS1]
MIRLLSDPYIDSLLQELDIKVILLGRGSLEFIFQLKPALQKHVDERRSGPFNELTEALSTVDITISPALFGAGVKNKVLEANNAEKLCLASRECAGEYGYDETLTIYFQDGRHLAQKINSLNVALKEFGSCSSAMLKLRGEIISLFRGI